MKPLLTIALLLLAALNIPAQQPKVIIKLADGSQKIYNLADIENFSFRLLLQQTDTGAVVKTAHTIYTQMQIFYSQTKTAYYPPYLIDKITMDTTDLFSVYISGYPKNYKLHTIDSIIFYPTKYPAITIGEQVWMTKNLDVDHYQNGDSIPEVRDSIAWANLTTGAWCNYNNSDSLGKIYGKLYNWFSVDDKRGLAPKGWHVPSYYELIILREYYGGYYNAGSKLKETSNFHWYPKNEGATNESGFSALPCGNRFQSGEYRNIGSSSGWWTSGNYNFSDNWAWAVLGYSTILDTAHVSSKYGYAVRCIMDK